MIGDLGELVASQTEQALQSLADRDSALTSDVAERDKRIDELEDEAREFGIRLPALHQPMARDLRFIVSATSVATDLERLGHPFSSCRRSASTRRRFMPKSQIASREAERTWMIRSSGHSRHSRSSTKPIRFRQTAWR